MSRVGVFLDRDGTVIEEVGYVNHPDRMKLLPRSAEAIRLLNDAGLPAILVTNQSGVARGYFPEKLVQELHEKLARILAREGASFDGIYYCPHHPDVGAPGLRMDCDCRKPRTGMLDRASADLGIDLPSSYMIGDTFRDVKCAQAAGVFAIRVQTGYGQGEMEHHPDRGRVIPDHEATDLLDAAAWIVARERKKAI